MEKTCEYCGATFYSSVSVKRFCRRSCKLLAEATIEPKNSLKTFGLAPLTVVKGDLMHTLKRVQRSENFLNFCLSLFWLSRNFKEEEKISFLNLIGKHFKGSMDIDACFKELVQRAVLYKREFSTKAYSFVPEPIDWFDGCYLYGITKTKSLLEEVKKQREQVPSYKLGLIVLSEGVLNYYDKRNVIDIQLYRNKFAATGDVELLQIYLNAVMQIQFLNH